MWTKRLVGISLAFLFLGQSALAERFLAEQTSEFPMGPLYYEKGSDEVSVVVQLPLGVTATASDFRLLMDSKNVATAYDLKRFVDSNREIDLLLCVDVSGSMAGGPLDDIKKALPTFLAKFTERDRIALMTFGTETQFPSGFQARREQLMLKIRKLRAEGKKGQTKLYEALFDALNYFVSEQRKSVSLGAKRQRIVVFSDGKQDEGSRPGTTSAEGVKQLSLTSGIPIDAVGRAKKEPESMRSLEFLAKSTGGIFIDASPDKLQLEDALISLYRQLMETRTVVAYFKYHPDFGRGLTEKVGIELLQSGAPSLKSSVDAKIPLAQLEPPPPPPPPPPPQPKPIPKWLTWLLSGVLAALLTGIVVLFARKQAKEPPPTQAFPPGTTPVSGPVQPVTPVMNRTAKAKRETVVGGYFPPPAADQPAAILIGVSGVMRDLRFPVEKEVFHIGANPDNDLVIPDDSYVSGNHAYIRYEKGSLLILDQRSLNGTFVNEKQLAETAQVLMPGDKIRVGSSTFQVIQAPGR